MQTTAISAAIRPPPSRVRVESPPQRAAADTFVPVAIRCAWCRGWMSAPTWPDRLPVSHGICPGCRDHVGCPPAQP